MINDKIEQMRQGMTSRRTFLKLGTALFGSVALTKYAEPTEIILPEHKDWIEERDDFYIIRVPDYKTFAHEQLNKNVIFLLGANSIVSDVMVSGYANIATKGPVTVRNSMFDCSMSTVEGRKDVIRLAANTQYLTLTGLHIINNPIDVENNAYWLAY